MKRTLQVLFTLAIVFALTSITFTLGNTLTGSIIATRFDLGLHFSYMTIATMSLITIIVCYDLFRTN